MPVSLWIGFSLFVLFALILDTFFLNQKFSRPHESMKAAFCWTFIWLASALIFNLLFWFYLYHTQGLAIANEKGLDFFTGYLIEKSLSVDNLFAFYMVFHQLHIPLKSQQRVFTYGIWSAIILRFVLILFLSYLLTLFHWLFYLMGLFLLLTGLKMLFTSEHEQTIADNKILVFLKRFLPVSHELEGEKFIIKRRGLWYLTPLFIALILVEISDLIFAFDSIPAIFAITTDPFIVWSSNIFAILGLRSLYFVLTGMMVRFELLKYGLACIVIFVGGKMIIEPWFNIPIAISLLTIASILFIFSYLSYWQTKRMVK